MGTLDGQVAVITGAGRGIGQAIALALAAEGATIVVSSRTESELAATLDAAGGSSGGTLVVADAMDRDDARRPVDIAVERFGRIDILVNNVGGNTGGDADPFGGNLAAFEQTVLLSLTSAWWSTSAALPAMREQGSGRVISIGSGASKRSGASVGYTAAKHGLVGMTKEIARAGAPHGINANLLCPGWTDTSLVDFERIAERRGTTPDAERDRAEAESLQQRILDPSELTAMAVLLAGPGGAGVTGQVISVDGGYKV